MTTGNTPDAPEELAFDREFAKAGIFSPALMEQAAQYREKAVDWQAYLSANMISAEELAAVQRYDRQPLAKLKATIEQEGDRVLTLFVSFLKKIVRVDTVQYLLSYLDDIILLAHHYPALCEKTKSLMPDAYGSLLRLLQKEDQFTQFMAGKVLAEFFCAWKEMSRKDVDAYLQWMVAQVKMPKSPYGAEVAVQCIHTFLRHDQMRAEVCHYPAAMETVAEALKQVASSVSTKSQTVNPQFQYQLILALWLMSFNDQAAHDMQSKCDVIPTLVDIAKTAVKEKVTRVCLATLRNMYSKAHDVVMLPMIGTKVPHLCENLLARKWSDEDIKEDLEFLKAELDRCIQKLSSFDEYSSELRTGKLEWSPAHTSEAFWKQNAHRLNEKDFELLKLLSRTLHVSSSPVVLAVACHDIGQYIKHFSHGKKFITDLGAKQKVMELMTHEDAEVRYHALLAVQTYMVNSWEF